MSWNKSKDKTRIFLLGMIKELKTSVMRIPGISEHIFPMMVLFMPRGTQVYKIANHKIIYVRT